MSLDPISAEGSEMPEEQAEPPSGEKTLTPGQLLRDQRETLQLSVANVAQQLNITMHFVRCIEDDVYDKLPEDVFVRGYLRSYARLLKLDPDQVLALYVELTQKKQARKEEAIKRYTRRRRDKNRPWIIFSGVAFVAVAIALWLGSESEPDDAVVTQPSSAAGSASSPVQGDEMVSQAVESVQQADSQSVPDEQAAAPEILADVPEDTDTPADLTATDLNIVETVQVTDSLTWPGDDVLQIEFLAESWVEIQHRAGDQAHRHMHQAGEIVRVQGTAPFSVLLSNARAVTVSYNGRALDISSAIRDDSSARLSLGM